MARDTGLHFGRKANKKARKIRRVSLPTGVVIMWKNTTRATYQHKCPKTSREELSTALVSMHTSKVINPMTLYTERESFLFFLSVTPSKLAFFLQSTAVWFSKVHGHPSRLLHSQLKHGFLVCFFVFFCGHFSVLFFSSVRAQTHMPLMFSLSFALNMNLKELWVNFTIYLTLT